jgi:hypothetical protein
LREPARGSRRTALTLLAVALVAGAALAGCNRGSGVQPDQAAAIQAKKKDPNK